jgi:hypothetical protein
MDCFVVHKLRAEGLNVSCLLGYDTTDCHVPSQLIVCPSEDRSIWLVEADQGLVRTRLAVQVIESTHILLWQVNQLHV